MKKQTKYVAVLSAAALLAMGASMTSFAAGWEKDEAGAWHYYDKDDDMATNEWKKDGNKWFYLDDDGDMAVNQWVDSDYYVGEDGAMLVNQWVKTLEDEDEVSDPDDSGEHWYYFGSKGKKVADQKKNIGGKTYHFDSDGKMLSGWQTAKDDDSVIYYLGGEDEGWEVKNQWRWLEKPGLIDEDGDGITGKNVFSTDGCDNEDDCDDEGWYWFDANGKLYHKPSEKTINGRKFVFNAHGQMLYEWVYGSKKKATTYAQLDAATDATIPVANMKWYQENGDGASNGAQYKGWQYIAGSESAHTDDKTNWYFFKDGAPKYAKEGNNLYDIDNTTTELKRMKEKLTWDGKSGYFCFDDNGKMKTGLQFVKGHTYFFNDDGYMQTGKVANVEEEGGDTFNYYFTTKNSGKGEGVTGPKDGYLYFQGKRLEADDDYRVYYVDGHYYLVNSKGRLQKNFSKKDIETNKGIKEDYTLTKDSIGKKNYVIDPTAVFTDKDSNTLTLAEVAVIPHIQLEDTANYVVDSKVFDSNTLDVADTEAIKDDDFLTLKELVDLESDGKISATITQAVKDLAKDLVK